jgi:hypothetical protein
MVDTDALAYICADVGCEVDMAEANEWAGFSRGERYWMQQARQVANATLDFLSTLNRREAP